MNTKFRPQELLQNIFASISLSIVTLSLAAAFGIMSGRGAMIGMISAAVIATITAALSGTRIQSSGPTAPTTILAASIIITGQSFSFPGVAPDQFINLVFVLAAVLLFLSGILRLGNFISLIPNVVISGFMTGIGLSILADQAGRVQDKISTIDPQLIATAIVVIVGTFLICLITPKLTQKYIPKWSGILSGTLISIVVFTLWAQWTGSALPRLDLGDAQHSGLASYFVPQILELSRITMSVIWAALPLALQLCIAVYIDSLLTSVIIDRITNTKTKRNKELMAQGVSTGVIGLIGGIPGAQATLRSVLLLKEGATMRIAPMLVGVFCLLGIFLFKDTIKLIPQAVFIGIIIKVAFDVIDLKPLRMYLKEVFSDHVLTDFFSRHDDEKIFVTNREVILILGTAILTVTTNLIISVITLTVLYHLGNRFLWKNNPIRDLQPATETDAGMSED